MEPIRNHPVNFTQKNSNKPKSSPASNLFKEKIKLPEQSLKKLKKGSRTTDDMTEKKVSALKRRTSQPNLQINKTNISLKADPLLAKKSALWNCIGRKLDNYGGELYFFEFKKTLENETKKINVLKKIFPALELDSMDMDFIFNPTAEKNSRLEQTYDNDDAYLINIFLLSEYRKDLRALGYDFKLNNNNHILILPDREALLARWAVLSEKKPGLPPLDIASSNGIASDLSFIEAFFAHDAILSSNKEFVHDHTFHVLPILSLLLSISDKHFYHKAKFEMVKIISGEYRRLIIAKDDLNEKLPSLDKNTQEIEKNKLSQMETALGAFVDSASASLNVIISKNGDLLNFNKETFDTLLSTLLKEWASPWQSYFEVRYGSIFNKSPKRVLRSNELLDLRKTILKIEADFDKKRHLDKEPT